MMANNVERGHELIHGNRDGPGKTNETFTICRTGVPRRRVAAEIKTGLHSNYHLVKVKGIYYPRNNPNSKAMDNVNAQEDGWRCPAQATDARPPSEGVPVTPGGEKRFLPGAPAKTRSMDFIHGEEPPVEAKKRTYTLCRLGVPRRQLVWEIAAGLHPDYGLVHSPRGDLPWPTNAAETQRWSCCMVAR
jgi:hypothetical protein